MRTPMPLPPPTGRAGGCASPLAWALLLLAASPTLAPAPDAQQLPPDSLTLDVFVIVPQKKTLKLHVGVKLAADPLAVVQNICSQFGANCPDGTLMMRHAQGISVPVAHLRELRPHERVEITASAAQTGGHALATKLGSWCRQCNDVASGRVVHYCHPVTGPTPPMPVTVHATPTRPTDVSMGATSTSPPPMDVTVILRLFGRYDIVYRQVLLFVHQW
jgi:hypothetical protein